MAGSCRVTKKESFSGANQHIAFSSYRQTFRVIKPITIIDIISYGIGKYEAVSTGISGNLCGTQIINATIAVYLYIIGQEVLIKSSL